jgi:hypothetical protein
MRSLLLLAVICFASPSVASPETLHLVCDGAAILGDGSTNNSYLTSGQVFVEIEGDSGRIQMPASLTPLIHTHSDQGWRQFQSFEATDTEFRGTFVLNFLSKPHVTISRITGHMDIEGFNGSFGGACQKFDQNGAARKF